jgi:hypothetical protein
LAGTKTSDIVCRGLAICSEKDNPCKKRGRDIAMGKCMQAMRKKKTDDPICRKEAERVLNQVTDQKTLLNMSWHKSQYDVLPANAFEQKMIFE